MAHRARKVARRIRDHATGLSQKRRKAEMALKSFPATVARPWTSFGVIHPMSDTSATGQEELVMAPCKFLFITSALMGVASCTGSPRYTSALDYMQSKATSMGPPEDWNYVHVDPVQARIYVARQAQIEVVDATSGAPLGAISGVRGTQGIVTVPTLNRGYAESGNEIVVFDLRTFRVLDRIPVTRRSVANP